MHRSLPWAEGFRLLLALCLTPLLGCGAEPAVRLSDLVAHQHDQVTTRWLPAQSEVTRRLASDGWTVDEDEDGAVLRMTRDRARVWFYSADGTTTGVELHGRFVDASGSERRTISCRVNDTAQATVGWSSDQPRLDLPFSVGAARAGWNALDLHVRREGAETGRGTLELDGLRFIDRFEGALRDERPAEITIEDGRLSMPGESTLDASFSVPADGRLELRAAGASERESDLSIQVVARLIDSTDRWHDLGDFWLEAGDSDSLTVDLTPWAEEPATLRLAVAGPRNVRAIFDRAEIAGGPVQETRAGIRPQAVEATRRLGRPDVFLIVLDAARADAFGAYGAAQPTPTIDALAAAGTTFERAQSPTAWTGQAMPTVLTGFYPDTLHTERWGDPLPDEVANVGELMAEAGYRTVLWSQHPIYNRAPSLVRGFEHIRYSGRGQRHKRPSRRLLLEKDRPTFALIHLLPPHSPYSPPEPFRGRLTSDYQGDFPAKLGALGRIGRKRAMAISPEDLDYIRNRYLENVAFADWLVESILSHLTAARRFQDTLIIVTSDHGEAFLEHGLFMHSRELYQEFVRVPMVVKWPAGVEGFASRVAEPVTLADLVPTLVDGLGLRGDRGFQGRSLLPAVFDGERLDRAIYGTTRGLGDIDKVPKPRWMLERGEWRVIHDPVAARTELFAAGDLEDRDDLADESPAIARWMLQQLLVQRTFNRSLLRLGPRSEVELDPEMVEELKALGYL